MKFAGIKIRSPEFAALCLALVCMAGLRAAYFFLPLPDGDGGLYRASASRLVNGGYLFSGGKETFELLYRTPGYPLFLAILSGLSGNSFKAVALAQHFIGILSAFLAYLIGKRVWGRPAALLCALFTGLHFHFLYAESYPLSEALSVFLLSAALYLALTLNSDGKAGAAAFGLGGLVLACGALCRPEIAGVAPLCSIYFWFGRSAPAARKLGRISSYLLPLVLLVGAWTLRNGLLFDYWGMTPNAQVAFFDGPAGMCVQPGKGTDIVSAQALAHQYDYGRVNRAVSVLEEFGISYQWSAKRIGALALAAAAEDPGAYFRLSMRQLREVLFTGPTWPPRDITETMPDLFASGSDSRTRSFLLALGRLEGNLEGIFLAPLFLAGCLAALFMRSKDGILLGAAAAYLLVTYAFLSPVSLRYRIVAEPFMGLLAAGSLSIGWRRLAGIRVLAAADSNGRPAPGWLSGSRPLIVLAVSFCFWFWFMAELSLAYRARSLCFTPEAAPLLSAAAAEPPDKEALLRLGWLSLERSMYPGALKYFDKALGLEPGSKSAGDGRAAALFKMGLGNAALEELRRGMSLYGNSPDLYYNAAAIGYLTGDAAGALRNLSVFLGFHDIPPPLRERALSMRAELYARGAGRDSQAPGRAMRRGLHKVRH